MDSYEASRTVFSRIQSLEPENASKIMGYLLIQDYGEKEMIRLAFGPETLLQNLILKAKTQLGLLTKTLSTPSSPSPFNPISRPNPLSLSSSSSSRISSNGFELSNPPTPSSNAWPISPSSGPVLSYASVVNRTSANTNSGSFSSTLPSFSSAYNSTSDLFEEYPLQENTLSRSTSTKTDDLFDPRLQWASMAASPSEYDDLQKQNYSVPGLYFGPEDVDSGFGCRPCLYFAKGFCKNGETCRFFHGDSTGEAFNSVVGSPNNNLNELEQCQELLRLKAAAQQQKLGSASQFMAGASFPYDNKSMNSLMQRQLDTQRSPTAAMMMGDEFHKFGRCRFDRNELSGLSLGVNPSSRQIYLTFPADSTFREEDVSNYFSIYGPVQDVRIPYQQKRMFGFVTFVYPETVKLILAKGNPHFVCDSRVLVKPYKEKGKIVEKKQQQQQLQFENVDYSLCSSPSAHDYDLHRGPRMFYNTQEMLLMKKLEERASFQQAIELHERRLMNLQLIDLKSHHHHHRQHDHLTRSFSSVSSIPSPTALSYSPNNQVHIFPSNQIEQEVSEENNDKSAATILQNTGLDAKQNLELEPNPTCNPINGSHDNSGSDKELTKTEENALRESIEHILPDSLFASPKKSATENNTAFSNASEEPSEMANTTNSNNTSLLSTSTLNIASPKSVFNKCSGFLLGMEPLECN